MSGGYAWPLYMCLALPVAALGLTLAMREPRPI